MSSTIPIKNIYYLLCYAWDQLEQGELIDVDASDSSELLDLFALVLCDGIYHLARRGLEQGYELVDEEIAGVRGRVDMSTTVKRALFTRGRAHCEFDELTSNTPANRILKTTLRNLSRVPELDLKLKKRVHITLRDLRSIELTPLTAKLFRTARVHSHSRFYLFLLNVCELIYESLFVDERAGTEKFRDFSRDDARMAKLFESFLRNFLTRECPQWSVDRENVDWNASSRTDPLLKFLPRMQTDISLYKDSQYLIVDAKYYREAMATHFATEKFRSGHLYQLLSYVLNARPRRNIQASGMLIYPRVDRELREQYEVLGREISICTIDLGRPWRSIDTELREIFQ